MHNSPVRRVDLDPELSGPERIKVLLAAKGFTVSSWARKRGYHSSQVFKAISGDRAYPEILEKLAEDVGRPVEAIRALVPEPEAPQPASSEEPTAEARTA